MEKRQIRVHDLMEKAQQDADKDTPYRDAARHVADQLSVLINSFVNLDRDDGGVINVYAITINIDLPPARDTTDLFCDWSRVHAALPESLTQVQVPGLTIPDSLRARMRQIQRIAGAHGQNGHDGNGNNGHNGGPSDPGPS